MKWTTDRYIQQKGDTYEQKLDRKFILRGSIYTMFNNVVKLKLIQSERDHTG